jgi:DNA polymerase-3 subunit delta'
MTGGAPFPWLAAPLRQALALRGHALLVQGSAGVGALALLRTLAQALLCEGMGDVRPCGQCASCRLTAGGTHPDLRQLLPESLRGTDDPGSEEEGGTGSSRSKKKPSRQIRIDEVRAAIDWIALSSARGRAKVLLLYPAEAMNLQSASALLKTLEEPPGQARLLLGTADAGLLLPTLRSRCQRLALGAPDAAQARAWLEARGVAGAEALLAAAGGAPVDAAALAEAGIDAEAWRALPRALAAGRTATFQGWPLARVLDALQKICHDLQVAAAGGEPRFFDAGSLPPGARAVALSRWGGTLTRVARHDEHPWNEGLLVEALVAEGRACWQDDTPAPATSGGAAATLSR